MRSRSTEQFIEWKTTGGSDKRDLVCFINGNTLRVEQLDKGIWWYCIYIGDHEFMSGDYFPHARTFEEAKIFCERIYRLLYSFTAKHTQ